MRVTYDNALLPSMHIQRKERYDQRSGTYHKETERDHIKEERISKLCAKETHFHQDTHTHVTAKLRKSATPIWLISMEFSLFRNALLGEVLMLSTTTTP